MATLKDVLKAGALAAVGFMAHRALTALCGEFVFSKIISAGAGPATPPAPTSGLDALAKWEKPICGAVVVAAGVGVTGMLPIKREAKMALGAGMVASWVQSVVVSALMAADQPKAVSYLSGYTNSMAYSLRGMRRNRRGMRGMGALTSIMPRYTPVGAFQQAAAGTHMPNRRRGMRGTGEYFTSNAMGEYFAPMSTQGVGQYEPAGPLAMQAAAGFGQIDDGIRPDSNLDRVLDLAESAAGLGGRGLGEYYTAAPDNSGFAEERVPTDSQWIPNGPLWAGELGVKANIETSEIPAGILATPGGNGVLSGG